MEKAKKGQFKKDKNQEYTLPIVSPSSRNKRQYRASIYVSDKDRQKNLFANMKRSALINDPNIKLSAN